MAANRKKDTAIDESILENIYYYHLWKDRLNWTKHAIPVRVKDPISGFFIEAYIYTVAKITDLNQKILVYDAFLPSTNVSEFEVSIQHVYPTTRLIHSHTGEKISILNTKFIPNETFSDLEAIFKRYPKMSFTFAEICSMLNINPSTSSNLEERLIKDGNKFCLITGSLLPSYSGYKPLTIKFDEVKMNSQEIIADINTIYHNYKDCSGCELAQHRNNRITEERPENPPTFGRLCNQLQPNIKLTTDIICFIGEAPGVIEEDTKIGFNPTAPAGDVLARVIKAASIPEDKCYFTNAVLCRPEATTKASQNGTPGVDHIKACNKRLKTELAILNPKIIVLLGRTAYYAYYGKYPPNVLGSLGWQDNKNVYFAPHPSFVLREISFALPENVNTIKIKYLEHFKMIKERYTQ